MSNVLQGDDILALAIKREDLKKVRMKSPNPFLQERGLTRLCGRPSPRPPSLPPPYSQGASNSMQKATEHEFFSLLHLKEFTVCFYHF